MSGFLPRGYFRLAEVRDVMGIEALGSWLAAGEMIAAARDTDGTVQELHPAGWMDEGASDHIAAGELPKTEGLGPFPLFVRSRNPNHLIAIMDVRREGAAPPAVLTGSSLGLVRATPRSPRPSDERALTDWFEERVAEGALPPSKLETEKWARDRGLPREWARAQLRKMPPTLRRAAGSGGPAA